MKKILIACIVTVLGMLLPVTETSAFFTSIHYASHKAKAHRIVDIYLDDSDVWFESDSEKGEITMARIYHGSEIVHQQTYGSGNYLVSVDVSGFPRGNYTAVLYATNTTYSEGFSL